MDFRGFNDTSAPNFALTINGTDYSRLVESFTVEASFLDSENIGAKTWEGAIILDNTIARYSGGYVAAVDIDPVTNTDLLRGNAVVVTPKSQAFNFIVLECKVTGRGADLSATRIEVKIGCKLSLVDRNDFEGSPTRTIDQTQSIGFGLVQVSYGYTSWTQAIIDELTWPTKSDGNSWITNSDIDFSSISTTLNNRFFPNGNPVPDAYDISQPRDGNNPVDNASANARNRGYILAQDLTDGIIKLWQYPLYSSDGTLTGRYALPQLLEGGFEQSGEPLDEPVETINQQSVALKVARPEDEGGNEPDMQTYPITIALATAPPPSDLNGTPIVVCERIEQRPNDSGSSWTQSYRIRARSFWLFPKSPSDTTQFNTSTSWVTVVTGTIRRTYNDAGLPLTNDDIQSISRGVNINNGIPQAHDKIPISSTYYGDTTLVSGQGTRESFTYDSVGIPIKRELETRGTLVSLSLNDTPGDTETDVTAVRVLRRETENNTRKPDGRYQQIISYQVAEMDITGDNDDRSLVADPDKNPVVRTLDGVPKPDSLQPPTEPVTPSVSESEETVTSNFGRNIKVTRISKGGLDSQHSRALARLTIALKQQGAITWEIRRALGDTETLRPFALQHYHDRAVIVDGERLEFSGGVLVFEAIGRQCGVLSAAVTVPKRSYSSGAGGSLVVLDVPDFS